MKKFMCLAFLMVQGVGVSAQGHSVTAGVSGLTEWIAGGGEVIGGLNAYCSASGTWLGEASDGPATLPQRCNYTAVAATPTATWRRACPGSANGNASTDGKCWIGNAGDVIPAGFARAGQAVDYTTIQSALNNSVGNCGIWFSLLPTSNNAPTGAPRTYSENITWPNNATCNASNWNWLTTGNYAGLPDENSRINPSYAGYGQIPARPTYATVNGVYVPKVVGTQANTPVFTYGPNLAYWRLIGLEVTTQNGLTNSGPLIGQPGGAYGQLDLTVCSGANAPVNGCTAGNTVATFVTGSGHGWTMGQPPAIDGAAVIVNNAAVPALHFIDGNNVLLGGTPFLNADTACGIKASNGSGQLGAMLPLQSGTVTTSETGVTWVSGDQFMSGKTWIAAAGYKMIKVNGSFYTISSVTSGTSLTTIGKGPGTNSVPVCWYHPAAFNMNSPTGNNVIFDRMLLHGGNDPHWQNNAAPSADGIGTSSAANVSIINSYIADLWNGQSDAAQRDVSAACTGNVVTITGVVSSASYAPNQTLSVTGFQTYKTYNGNYKVASVPSASSITYSIEACPAGADKGGTVKVLLQVGNGESKAISGGTGAVQLNTLKIVNNFLESSSENVFLAGAQSGGSPTNIEMRRNHLYKPLFWNKFCVNPQTGVVNVASDGVKVARSSGVFFSAGWTSVSVNGKSYAISGTPAQNSLTLQAPGVGGALKDATLSVAQLPSYCQGVTSDGLYRNIKSDMEWKAGNQSLIEANIFENSWGGQSDQPGTSVNLNLFQNSNDAFPGETQQNATIRYNIMAHGNRCFSAANYGALRGPMAGGYGMFSIHDNLCDDIDNAKWGMSVGGQPQVGAVGIVTNSAYSGSWSPHDVVVAHNTIIQSTAGGILPAMSAGVFWGWTDVSNYTPTMNGTVNTVQLPNGITLVTLTAGTDFPTDGNLGGQTIQIGEKWYQVLVVTSPKTLYLTPGVSPGSTSGASYWSQCKSGKCTNETTPVGKWPNLRAVDNIATGGMNGSITAISGTTNHLNAIGVTSGATGWCFGPNLLATNQLAGQKSTSPHPTSSAGSGCPAFGVGNKTVTNLAGVGFTSYTDGGWTKLLPGGTNDYVLTSGSAGHAAASDKKDLGADMGALKGYTSGVE